MAVPVGWQPGTEAELRAAAANELLEETHYLDIKRELGRLAAALIGKLARHLASFAIDRGLLIIGVDQSRALQS